MRSEPIVPDASADARALLSLLHDISGSRVLSGQHNTPGAISTFSQEAERLTGHAPAIWGQDFGFAEGGQDGIEHRDDVLREAIAQHRTGAIVTFTWHAVRPIEEEPGTFKGSCQGPLSHEEWSGIFEPGEVRERWLRQIDLVAELLGRLRDAGVPVLWRPYHEMNGDWFWWCDRRDEPSFTALWEAMFDRFTNHHRLNNLVWVWSPNCLRHQARPYAEFFPGPDRVDVLATDVYGAAYSEPTYRDLLELSGGKPVALGEVGDLPTPELLEAQPRWCWFLTWSGFLARNDPAEVRRLYEHPRTMHRDEVRDHLR